MANQDLMNSLFGDGGVKVNATSQPNEASNVFKPKASKGQGGKYTAVIRFVCNIENPAEKSVISKYTCFVKNPVTKQGRTVDSPSTVGDPDPLTQMFFAIRNNKTLPDAQKKEMEDSFKRHLEYRSLVEVIEAPNEPNIVGKILIWKYGQKIHDKIQQEMTPVMQGVPAGQPFDLFNGRLFKVVATQNGPYDNFDQSTFFDLAYPANCLRIPVTQNDANGHPVTQYVAASRELAQTPEGRQTITDFLEKNSPKLTPFEYKPWDEETRKYVDEMILLYSQILDGKPMNMPQQNAIANQMIQNQQMNPMTPQSSMMNGGMPSMNSILSTPQTAPQVASQPIQQPMMNIPTPTDAPVATPTQTVPTTTPGLSLGVGSDGLGVPQGNTPSIGGVNGLDANSLTSIMGTSVAPAQSSPAPTSNLGAILGDVMA